MRYKYSDILKTLTIVYYDTSSATRRALKLVARALKALINVYHTLFFITPALQSENHSKKSKLN
jgi:hypothetical protein